MRDDAEMYLGPGCENVGRIRRNHGVVFVVGLLSVRHM